jgi:hypothetical protein
MSIQIDGAHNFMGSKALYLTGKQNDAGLQKRLATATATSGSGGGGAAEHSHRPSSKKPPSAWSASQLSTSNRGEDVEKQVQSMAMMTSATPQERSSVLKHLSIHSPSGYTLMHDLYTPNRSYIFSNATTQSTSASGSASRRRPAVPDRVASARRRQKLTEEYQQKFEKHRQRMQARRAGGGNSYAPQGGGTGSQARDTNAWQQQHQHQQQATHAVGSNWGGGSESFDPASNADHNQHMQQSMYSQDDDDDEDEIETWLKSRSHSAESSENVLQRNNRSSQLSDHHQMLALLGLTDGRVPNDLAGPFRNEKGTPTPCIKHVSTYEDYLERTVNHVRTSPVHFNKRSVASCCMIRAFVFA